MKPRSYHFTGWDDKQHTKYETAQLQRPKQSATGQLNGNVTGPQETYVQATTPIKPTTTEIQHAPANVSFFSLTCLDTFQQLACIILGERYARQDFILVSLIYLLELSYWLIVVGKDGAEVTCEK